jgi:predicted dehydrogenase
VVRPKQESWRTNPEEGGGCLMDYASHIIDLINDILSPVEKVSSSHLKSIFSKEVDDAVFAMLELRNKVSGMLSVNWSDDTFRKMTTSITLNGTKGKIISDANELKVHFKDKEAPEGYNTGWNVKYVTDLTEPVDYYLRGEEYSAQLDYFIQSVKGTKPNNINTFETAALTDRAISMIRKAQS